MDWRRSGRSMRGNGSSQELEGKTGKLNTKVVTLCGYLDESIVVKAIVWWMAEWVLKRTAHFSE